MLVLDLLMVISKVRRMFDGSFSGKEWGDIPNYFNQIKFRKLGVFFWLNEMGITVSGRAVIIVETVSSI
jgi:hypothetical protein